MFRVAQHISQYAPVFKNIVRKIQQAFRSAQVKFLNIHFVQRLFSQSGVLLLICIALLTILLAINVDEYVKEHRRRPYILWSNMLTQFTVLLNDEAMLTRTYLESAARLPSGDHTNDLLALRTSWSNTDDAALELVDFFVQNSIGTSSNRTITTLNNSTQSENKSHAQIPGVTLEETFLALCLARIRFFRSGITPTIQTTVNQAAKLYSEVVQQMLTLSAHVQTIGASQSLRHMYTLISWTLEIANVGDGIQLDLRDSYRGFIRARAIKNLLLKPYLSKRVVSEYTMQEASLVMHNFPPKTEIVDVLVDEIRTVIMQGAETHMEAVLNTPESGFSDLMVEGVHQINQVLATSLSNANAIIAPHHDRYIPYVVLVALAGSFLVINAVGLLNHNGQAETMRQRCVIVVEQTVRRFQEYADCFSTFKLEPTHFEPVQRKDNGEDWCKLHLTLIDAEITLQQCIASVRALAPYIPHSLFPDRLIQAAKSLLEVRKQEQGLGDASWGVKQHFGNGCGSSRCEMSPPPLTEVIKLCTLRDALNSKELNSVINKTSVGLRRMNIIVLTLDVSPLHNTVLTPAENENDHAIKNFEEALTAAYNKVLNLVERCVLLRGGFIHCIQADRVIAVWNLTNPVPQSELQACEAALQIVQRVNLARRTHIMLPQVPIHIGVTCGNCAVGVVGYERHKTFQVLGRPVSEGILIARVCATHGNNICCDEATRKAIEHSLPCKPVEILTNGIAYHVYPRTARRETDFFTKLAAYTRAFELFEKRHYRDALKAFRQYTRQYGYDRSVEYTQGLITG